MNPILKTIVTSFILFLSFIVYSQNQNTKVIDSLHSLVSSKEVTEHNKADAYLELSKIYIYKDLDSAEVYAQKGMDISVKSNYERGKAVYYIRKCKISEFSNELTEAIDYGNKAIGLYDNLEKDRNYLVIVNIQAYLFEKQSKIDTALELYLMGLKEAKFQKNELFEAVFYNNLSGIYSILGQLDQSIELSLKAAKIYKSLGLKMYYGSALLNIGNKYIKTEQYDLAQKYLNDAKVLSLEMNDFSALQNIELNLGIIEYEKKNYDLTLDHYQKGLAFAERLNDLDDYKASSVACMQENLGSIYKDLEQYDESIKIYQKAIAYGEKLNSIHILGRAYYDLFEIYQTLNKPDSAFYYIHKYLPINDRIQEETHNKRIEELNFQSKLEDEKTKYDQEKKLILANREKEKLKYVTIISLLGFISFAILFFWNVKRSKLIKSELKRQNLELEKEKLDLKLERTNRELSTSLLNLIERNEFVSEISSKLESIDAIQNEGDRRNIQSIIRDIDRNTSKKLWDELELSYIAVHKDFFDKLQSICPGLSSNERRLCSLIMLNLSTKDISSITYQSEHSIKIARYRLRKKLNLEKNSNLISFLSSI